MTNPDSAFYLQSIISDCIWNITNEIAAIGQTVDSNAVVLRDDLDYIDENLNALSNTALQTVGAMSTVDEAEDVVKDDSEEQDTEELTFGKTAVCENFASVYGDSNVGGIAGNLSIESDLDPESELSTGSNAFVKNRINLSIVLTGCVNRGEVTAKNECVGGIAGKMDMGLASRCASYGPVVLEDGDYAGGITGLLYGSVKNSWAKCSLSGNRYIGGVVGNGYTARGGDERSSTVSDCYALVEILGAPQFAGAVSGGADGIYENNYFVPADYAGLDRLSIHGQAEPISFADFAKVDGIPEECKHFTLRFQVEDAVVKELSFDYGASFDRSIFPRVERRDGAYAVWDRSDLTDLRFDTTVTAEYRLDETVLRSEEEREDGRAVLYVDGQFQQGDTMSLEQIPVEEEDIRLFSATWQETMKAQLRSILRDRDPDYSIPVSVAEHLRVSFSDDGQRTHSLRYLPPDMQTENYRLYLAGEDGWERIHPDTFGSYYLIDVTGTEAELMLVSTIQSWWIAAYAVAALVILVLLIILIVRLRKLLRKRSKKERVPRAARPFPRWLRAHRKPILILLPILLLVGAGAAMALRFGNVGSAISAYRVLKEFSTQETDVLTEIRIHSDERDIELNTTVHRVSQDGRMIRCTEQYGIPLYISDGMVCLENGRAFRLGEGQLSQGKVLDLVLNVFLHEQSKKTVEDGVTCYGTTVSGDTADRILQMFVPASGDELLHADSLSVALYTEEDALQRIAFTGTGAAANSGTLSIDVQLIPQAMTERPVIPQAVLDTILNGGGEDTQLLTEDLLRLVSAWVKNESSETVSADITVNADCGSLSLNPRYRYSRRSVDGVDVHCIKSALFTLYFTDSAACTASGFDLSEAQQHVVDAAQLIPLARELCFKGQFSSVSTGDRMIFTVLLSDDDAADLVSRLLPELDRLNISYDDCRLRITVADGWLDAIELDCGGSLRVVSRDIEVSVNVSAAFNDDAADEVPAVVKNVLLK